MSTYNIGTGRGNITLRNVRGIGMLGFSLPGQRTNGRVQYTLYARAFAIHDDTNDKHIMMVICDLWSCTEQIKTRVVEQLHKEGNRTYSYENLMISGTHTHSTPGGYSAYKLYNLTNSADNQLEKAAQNVDKIVHGIVEAIQQAHSNLAPGKIYIHTGVNNTIENCGTNRSIEAYERNPAEERARYGCSTDNYMTLIKFVSLIHGQPIGVLSWYPLHGTDMGQTNRRISGDNKGYAAHLFEEEVDGPTPNQPFIAAFANAHCGDVSGNLTPPKGGQHDINNMKKHGRLQYEKAKEMAEDESNLVELEGSIDFAYLDKVDMTNVTHIGGDANKRTYVPAVGLALCAGSQSDGTTPLFFLNLLNENKGLRAGELIPTEKDTLELVRKITCGGPSQPEPSIAQTKQEEEHVNKICISLDSTPVSELSDEQVAGHHPKPIAIYPKDFVPTQLPMQILKIGNLVIPAIPAELTTMAGRRFKQSTLEAFAGTEVQYLALGTYSNAYSQYITTKEEYEHQSYEGASTLFGPYTLEAYQQIFLELAKRLKQQVNLLA
jgi:neutral ceramidase